MANPISKIKKVSLREIWLKEDRDFTKWLEENIDYLNDVIGIKINILSREEKVGPFKVDLFGEDKNGNKVIIENQLEKTDHTHLGQMITYLTNLEAKTAIWITSDPTEEHEKAIDWLNEVTPEDTSFYLIKLEAIRIGDNPIAAPLFTIIAQPTIERRELGSEKKEYARRYSFRERFWNQFLEKANQKNKLFSNISPGKESWIGIGMGKGGFNLNLVVSRKYARAEIYINRGTQEKNKGAFNQLFLLKKEIENLFGKTLLWEKMESGVTSRIKYQLDGVNLYNESDWPHMIDFLVNSSEKMFHTFKDPIRKLKD